MGAPSFYLFIFHKISRHAAPSSQNVTGQAECSQIAVIHTPSPPLVIAAPAATLSDCRAWRASAGILSTQVCLQLGYCETPPTTLGFRKMAANIPTPRHRDPAHQEQRKKCWGCEERRPREGEGSEGGPREPRRPGAGRAGCGSRRGRATSLGRGWKSSQGPQPAHLLRPAAGAQSCARSSLGLQAWGLGWRGRWRWG